jgi:hypothetical protein
MAQQVRQYINHVLNAIRRLGGSARPGEVSTAVIKDMGLENSPILNSTFAIFQG